MLALQHSMLYTVRMGKVLSFRAQEIRRRDYITQDEFQDLLDSIEQMLYELKPRRKMPDKIDEAMSYVNQIRFCGLFSLPFRQEYYWQLDELADDLYAELNEEQSA